MSLAEFALLVGAEPKWVLNTLTLLQRAPRYSLTLARRLAITRAIVDATGAPVTRAFDLAERGLRQDHATPAVIRNADNTAGVWVDLPRILSSFSVRLSQLRTTFAPRQRGRPRSRRRNALQAASDYGIDLTLLADNARKSPQQRLRQLDAMVKFARNVRRGA